MRGFQTLAARDAIRVRRWDAVILGGALPGLVAAVRLGMRGIRVLILEEDASTRAFWGLREPFLMTGSGSSGVLGPCLEALGVPMLARQRIELDPLAYQIASPTARIDIAEPEWTAEEFESWGLVSGADARDIVSALVREAEAEAEALLSARIVRSPRRIGRRRGDVASPAPPERRSDTAARAWEGHAALAPLLAAQVCALCDVANTPPPAPARARLLGAALGGSARMATPRGSLRGLLRKRIEALFGEFRTIGSELSLVNASGLPAVAPADESDVLAGRCLLVNAPLAGLRAATGDRIPRWLRGTEPTSERLQLHYVGRRSQLPPGMAPRVIWIRDPDAPPRGANVVTLKWHPRPEPHGETVDLIASLVAERGADRIALRDHLEADLSELMPYSDAGWRRVATPHATWDRDGLLDDPDPEPTWPGQVSLQPSPRAPIHVLDPRATAALGFEGSLLLGWRAGDAIAGQLG